MRKKTLLVFLLCLIIIGFVPSSSVYASIDKSISYTEAHSGSWVEDNSIYGDNINTSGGDLQTDADPGFIERGFAKLIISIGDGIRSLLGEELTITRIIYGRVKMGNDAAKINHFSFELEKGNVYGIVGSIGYNILRTLLFSACACIMMYYFVKASYSNSAKTRDQLKGNLSHFIIVLGFLVIMPQLIDVLIYARDLMLHYAGNAFSSTSSTLLRSHGMETNSDVVGNFVLQYRQIADDCKTFTNAAMYLSVTILSIFFAFSYVTMAVSTMIVFMFFPVFVMLSFQDKQLLNSWFKYMFSSIVTPLIDCILLYVPMMSVAIGAPTVVQFFICMSILPSRGVIRQLLGVGRSMGSEMLGVGAMMAAGRLVSSGAKGVMSNVRGFTGGVSSAHSDRRRAKLHDRLGKIDESTYDNGVASENEDFSPSNPNANNLLNNLNSTGDISESSVATTASTNFRRPDATLTQAQYGKDATSFEGAERNAAYADFANYKNFDDREISSHLTDQQKADFYRQRARRTIAKSSTRLVGGLAGGLAGGALGASGSMFLGTTAMAMMAGTGFVVGNAVGGAVGEQAGNLAMASGEYAGQKVQQIGSTAAVVTTVTTMNDRLNGQWADNEAQIYKLEPNTKELNNINANLDAYAPIPEQQPDTKLGQLRNRIENEVGQAGSNVTEQPTSSNAPTTRPSFANRTMLKNKKISKGSSANVHIKTSTKVARSQVISAHSSSPSQVTNEIPINPEPSFNSRYEQTQAELNEKAQSLNVIVQMNSNVIKETLSQNFKPNNVKVQQKIAEMKQNGCTFDDKYMKKRAVFQVTAEELYDKIPALKEKNIEMVDLRQQLKEINARRNTNSNGRK